LKFIILKLITSENQKTDRMNPNDIDSPHITERNSKFNIVIGKYWIFGLLRLHAFISIFRTLKRQIVQKDLFNLRQSYYPEVIYLKYQ
jgi:hypothetical protein